MFVIVFLLHVSITESLVELMHIQTVTIYVDCILSSLVYHLRLTIYFGALYDRMRLSQLIRCPSQGLNGLEPFQ